MKILCLYNTMDLPETLLIKRVAEAGHAVEVCCNTSSGFWHLLEGSLPVEHLVCKSRLDLKVVRMLRARFREGRYDLVHAFTSKTLAAVNLACIGLSDRPKIAAYRGAMGNVHWSFPSSWITFLHPNVAGVNCVSDAVLTDLLRSGVSEQRAVRIYKGHELSWYQQPITDDRTALGIPSDAFVVGCVANARPNKGVDVLLDAAAALSERTPPVHLLLIGHMEHQSLKRRASQPALAGRVHFTGWRADATQLLPNCDLFVMPTRLREGFPKAVIEAMAQGIPPIVSGVGGMCELVRDQIDGLVVPPGDARALADAIVSLQESPERRTALGACAKRSIEERFPLSNTVRETLRFYGALTGRGERCSTASLEERMRGLADADDSRRSDLSASRASFS